MIARVDDISHPCRSICFLFEGSFTTPMNPKNHEPKAAFPLCWLIGSSINLHALMASVPPTALRGLRPLLPVREAYNHDGSDQEQDAYDILYVQALLVVQHADEHREDDLRDA